MKSSYLINQINQKIIIISHGKQKETEIFDDFKYKSLSFYCKEGKSIKCGNSINKIDLPNLICQNQIPEPNEIFSKDNATNDITNPVYIHTNEKIYITHPKMKLQIDPLKLSFRKQEICGIYFCFFNGTEMVNMKILSWDYFIGPRSIQECITDCITEIKINKSINIDLIPEQLDIYIWSCRGCKEEMIIEKKTIEVEKGGKKNKSKKNKSKKNKSKKNI